MSQRTARFVVLNPFCEDWGAVNEDAYLKVPIWRGLMRASFLSYFVANDFAFADVGHEL